MEREILFRGKRIDNGEWDYGYPFVSDPDGSAYILRGSREFTPGHEVNPDTLKPYTGLIDKNGVKIFEGDIVNVGTYTGNLKSELGVITYDDNGAVFFIKYSAYESYFDNEDEIEVIGNIHDNPELLEVQNEDKTD